jgi:DNA-binding CsgD family transcriptional regulator
MSISLPQFIETQRVKLSQQFSSQPDVFDTISEQNHLEEIASLKSTLHHERFFFVVNIRSFALEHIHGVESCLGYQSFSIGDYIACIHPGSLSIVMAMAETAMDLSKKEKVSFMGQRFIASVPLRHKAGHYLLVKRVLSPWQIDSEGRVTAYLNELVIIGNYDGEPLNPRIEASHIEEIEDKFREEVVKRFEQGNHPFSLNEIRIARLLHYQNSLSKKEIAQKLNLQESSIITYCKTLKEKASIFFFNDAFKDAREVSKYLHKMSII